jgi:hypothetical protein
MALLRVTLYKMSSDLLVSVSQSRFRDYAILWNSLTCLGGIFLDRVDFITDLGVLMDSRMSFSRHIDVTVGKVLANAGVCEKFVRS